MYTSLPIQPESSSLLESIEKANNKHQVLKNHFHQSKITSEQFLALVII